MASHPAGYFQQYDDGGGRLVRCALRVRLLECDWKGELAVPDDRGGSTDPLEEAARLYERYADLAALAEEAALRSLEEVPGQEAQAERPLGLVIRTTS